MGLGATLPNQTIFLLASLSLTFIVLFFGTGGQHCSRSAFGRSSGSHASGHYFFDYFILPPPSTVFFLSPTFICNGKFPQNSHNGTAISGPLLSTVFSFLSPSQPFLRD